MGAVAFVPCLRLCTILWSIFSAAPLLLALSRVVLRPYLLLLFFFISTGRVVGFCGGSCKVMNNHEASSMFFSLCRFSWFLVLFFPSPNRFTVCVRIPCSIGASLSHACSASEETQYAVLLLIFSSALGLLCF